MPSLSVRLSSSLLPYLIQKCLDQGTSPPDLTSTAYSTATDIFPSRFPKSTNLQNAYLVTGLVRALVTPLVPRWLAVADDPCILLLLQPQTNQLNFWLYPYYTNAAFDQARATEQPGSSFKTLFLSVPHVALAHHFLWFTLHSYSGCPLHFWRPPFRR